MGTPRIQLPRGVGHGDYSLAVTDSPHEALARPRTAAGVLFFDEEDRILLVKPTYKPGWEIPGGYLHEGETPSEGAAREVKEELGITPPIGRLLVADWAPHPAEGDKLLFVFDGGFSRPPNSTASTSTRSRSVSTAFTTSTDSTRSSSPDSPAESTPHTPPGHRARPPTLSTERRTRKPGASAATARSSFDARLVQRQEVDDRFLVRMSRAHCSQHSRGLLGIAHGLDPALLALLHFAHFTVVGPRTGQGPPRPRDPPGAGSPGVVADPPRAGCLESIDHLLDMTLRDRYLDLQTHHARTLTTSVGPHFRLRARIPRSNRPTRRRLRAAPSRTAPAIAQRLLGRGRAPCGRPRPRPPASPRPPPPHSDRPPHAPPCDPPHHPIFGRTPPLVTATIANVTYCAERQVDVESASRTQDT